MFDPNFAVNKNPNKTHKNNLKIMPRNTNESQTPLNEFNSDCIFFVKYIISKQTRKTKYSKG